MATSTPPPHRFTVLYYKRTNKVHKHRGTSRQDGILSIAPPPLSSVRLLDNDVADHNHDDDDDMNDDDSDEDDIPASKSHYKQRRGGKKKSKKRSALQKKTTNKSASAVIIYSGVNLELAKRAADIQDDEEIVLSGHWECQIISKLLDGAEKKKPILGAAHNHSNSTNSSAAKIGSRKWSSASGMMNNGKSSSLLTSSKSRNNSFMMKPPQQRGLISSSRGATIVGGPSSVASSMGRAPPLHSVKSSNHDVRMKQPSKLLDARADGLMKARASTAIGHAAAASNNNNAASLKSLASSSAAAAASGKVMKKDKNGEWYLDKAASSKHDDHDDDQDNATLASNMTTLKKTTIPSSLVRAKGASSTLGAGLMMRKRPLGNIAGGISSAGGGGLLKRNTMNMMSGNLKSTSTASLNNTKSTSSTAAVSNSNFFAGAVGDKINIPNSIREVLRPHQREGIAFLWNCVTGVSVGLNHAIVRARQRQSDAASCSSSLGSMGSFDLEDDGMDDSDVEYDDCGAASLQRNGGGGAKKMMMKGRDDPPMPRGAVLADEMGLGKTLMTIATIFALHRRKRDRRFIVVCPSSLVSNWAKEFDKWIGKASQPKRVIVRNGNEEGLRKLRSFVPIKPNQSEVLILSYELFRLHVKLICNAAKIGLLVVDEGHRLKNTAGSQTLSALNSISAEARILISGTVIQNNLSEFFTLASFAVPGILGDLNTFRRLYERPMSRANQKNATSGQKEKGRQQSKLLDSITSTFVLRRTQKDILKSILPPRQEILLFCRPTERQCQLYKNISNRASKSIGSIGGIEASNNPLMLLTEARKLCTHPSLLGEASDSSLEQLSGKMIVLGSLLDSIRQNNPTDKVVIISNFTSALTVIEDSILRKKNLPFVRLDGSTDNASRGPIVDSFNKRSIEHSFAFMLSSKAGGCGLNLIGANRLIMVDADWNPATDQQSMARIYRQGQTKPCFIYRLFTTGTVEEIIYQRQTQKGNLAKIANDGGSRKGSSTNASFTKEELRDCFTLKEGCKCDTKTKLGNKWSDYNGADSLRDDGFADAPLLGVCEDKADALSFVHVVDEDANPVDLDDDDNDAKKAASASGVDDDDDSSLGLGSESSSEEEEFEG